MRVGGQLDSLTRPQTCPGTRRTTERFFHGIDAGTCRFNAFDHEVLVEELRVLGGTVKVMRRQQGRQDRWFGLDLCLQ